MWGLEEDGTTKTSQFLGRNGGDIYSYPNSTQEASACPLGNHSKYSSMLKGERSGFPTL